MGPHHHHHLRSRVRLPHHPHRPTLPTKSTHNSHDMTIFHFLVFYTIQSIYFLKAGDTHNPLTHCPLSHHPHRPTLPTKSTHNLHNMIIFPLFSVLHYTKHIFSVSWYMG